MLDKVTRLIIGLALLLLALAGILLAIGHHPDNFLTNYQAESLADGAYGLLVMGFFLKVISRPPR